MIPLVLLFQVMLECYSGFLAFSNDREANNLIRREVATGFSQM